MFAPEFIAWLEGFRFPLSPRAARLSIRLSFEALDREHMWVIPALAVIMELYSRAVNKAWEVRAPGAYARAMTSGVREKIERLKRIDGMRIADSEPAPSRFPLAGLVRSGHARRLGEAFSAPSNCLIAMRREVEAIGTNAPRVADGLRRLAPDDEALARTPYDVLADLQDDYEGNLRVILPNNSVPRASSITPRSG